MIGTGVIGTGVIGTGTGSGRVTGEVRMGRRWVVAAAALAVVAVAAAVVLWRLGEREVVKTATLVGYEAQGSALTVAYLVGVGEGCGDPAGVSVDERADRVVVSARVRYAPGDRICPLAARTHRETVVLRRPLAGRAVVDGSGGPVAPLSGATPSPLPAS